MSNLTNKEGFKVNESIMAKYMENKKKHYNLASSKENMAMLSKKQKGELSAFLFDLKTEHDQMALGSSTKAQEAELLKKKIEILELNEKKSSNSFRQKSMLLSTMQAFIKEKKIIQSEEKECSYLFKKKIEKLSKDILIIQQETHAIENQTKKLESQIDFGKFNCHNTKTKVNTIHMEVTNQKEINSTHFNDQELQKGYYQQIIQQKNSFIQSADERKIRQQIVAEKAKNNTNDLNEIITRRKMELLKMYNHYLAVKMANQLQNNDEIENAFSQIRDSCGTQNVNEITDFILTKDKQYTLKQEQVSQNEIRQQGLKKKLQVLETKYQEMLTQVITKERKEGSSTMIEVVKENVINEADKELLAKESELLERLIAVLEVQKNVSLKYDKTIGNIKHLSNMFKSDFDNKGKTNPTEFNCVNNTVNNSNTAFDTWNNTGINIENHQLKKENIDPDSEEKTFNDYLTFLKNSFEAFNKLFLCNSKQDFLNMMKEKGAAQQEQLLRKTTTNNSKPIAKLPSNIFNVHNKSTLRKKSKHFIQSFSTNDILKKTNTSEDDKISQREQQTQKEIMRNFLQDIKKGRDDYIQCTKPLQ